MAIDQDVEDFLIMGDYDLIIRQAQGEWETRDVKIIPYRQHVEDLNKQFKSIEFSFIRKCHQFQVHGDLIHAPPIELHPMSAPWPFVAWGMDVIDPIEPKASNGHRFILVAIDYFTKWVEVVTLKSVTKRAVVDF
uniref:Protein NYNRIN-like n=1 Tax=Nicotiana tabacum TaxID=4097 RepID=A0A1S3ZF62_TOBAC